MEIIIPEDKIMKRKLIILRMLIFENSYNLVDRIMEGRVLTLTRIIYKIKEKQNENFINKK